MFGFSIWDDIVAGFEYAYYIITNDYDYSHNGGKN